MTGSASGDAASAEEALGCVIGIDLGTTNSAAAVRYALLFTGQCWGLMHGKLVS